MAGENAKKNLAISKDNLATEVTLNKVANKVKVTAAAQQQLKELNLDDETVAAVLKESIFG